MPAVIADLEFEQGIPRQLVIDDWTDDNGTAYDLTGYTADFQLRRHWQATETMLTLNSESGSIVIDTTAQQVTVNFEVEDIATITPFRGIVQDSSVPGKFFTGVWELRVISDGGVPYSMAKGAAYISLGAVKP